jgi:TDG/mug DNA glycosylase family protein
MDRETIATYERRGREWISKRSPRRLPEAQAFGAAIPGPGWRADLGCGPGWYTEALGAPAIAMDATRTMLDVARANAPSARLVQADLEALPFRRGALAGAWASASYVHVPAARVPFALADLHRAVVAGGLVHVTVIADRDTLATKDEFGGRLFSFWEPARLADVFEGAGFAIENMDDDGTWLHVRAQRLRTLPDTVGPGMALLLVGLNPSEYSADRGVGFARPGNRFWPAALAAGIVTRDRDTRHALAHHGVGMTDLVKRATPSAAELTPDEYAHGVARVERLVSWLEPRAVCVLGLTGWRHVVDRRAVAGWQPQLLAGRPVYLMPNPSGLNARAPLAVLTEHLRSSSLPAPLG